MRALEFLNQLANKQVQCRDGQHLKTMSFLAERTGLDDNSIPVVLITGTCGKGSTAQFLSAILEANGYQVGLIQSPHLVSFSERIGINRKPLSEGEITAKIEELLPVFEASIAIYPPNYNQVFLTTGLHLFNEYGMDIVIVEAGIGGYSDPCSYFDPIVSIITNIHKDHEFLLGNSYESIAYDKSGIIKPNRPIVTGTKIPAAMETIQREAQLKESPLFTLNRDFYIDGIGDKRFYIEKKVQIPLEITGLPEFQWENAALAIKAAQLLHTNGFRIEPNLLSQAIEQAKPPARFQIVSQSPLTVVDGAHNEEEIRRFCEAVHNLGCRHTSLIVGFSSNKDITGMINQLATVGDTLLLTPHSNEKRTSTMEELIAYSRLLGDKCVVVASLEEAYNYALEKACEDGGIFFTGSMFLAGDALKLLRLRDRKGINTEQ